MMNSGAAVKDTSRRLGVAPQPGPTRWVAGVASAGGVASPSVGTWWPVWVVAAASLALAGFAVQAWLDVAAVVALGLAVLVLAVLGFAAVLHRRLAVAEHDLARAQTEIERLSRSKSEFMNSAGHDLRHPVQAALLFQELLTRRLRGTAHEELIGNLGLSLGAMKAMLEAMLEVARLDVLTIRPHPAAIPASEVLDSLCKEFGPMAEAAGVSLRAVATGAVISSDRELLLSLLRKLVANAVKFTERGGVLLGCRRSGDRLRIQVWDTGRGMGEEAIAGLGTEFHQLHRVSGRGGPGRGESGFGFGLVVVQRLAAILGHPVGVRSVVGRGSMFEVVVPLIRVQT